MSKLYMQFIYEFILCNGDRILGGHANGSVSFQLAQLRVGAGKVPISIVLYIDATFIKRGIPIRPIYCKYICIHIRIQFMYSYMNSRYMYSYMNSYMYESIYECIYEFIYYKSSI
jgi:hypothetical protein